MSEGHIRWKLLLIPLAVFIADRLSKLWVVKSIPSGQDVLVIPHFFWLTHVYNNGAAFSLFADTQSPNSVRWMLIAFSVVAIAIVVAVLWRVGRSITATSVALSLILGGAVGNLYDRVASRYVVDFLAFNLFGYHYPDFNIADSCIVIGAIILLVEVFHAPNTLFAD